MLLGACCAYIMAFSSGGSFCFCRPQLDTIRTLTLHTFLKDKKFFHSFFLFGNLFLSACLVAWVIVSWNLILLSNTTRWFLSKEGVNKTNLQTLKCEQLSQAFILDQILLEMIQLQ